MQALYATFIFSLTCATFWINSTFIIMQQYLTTLEHALRSGVFKQNRTGVDTYSDFGNVARYDLSNGQIPLVTTKKMFYEKMTHETLWFVSGSTDVKYLKDNDVNIWDSWVIPETATYDADGKLLSGSIGEAAYGALWRSWNDVRIVSADNIDAYTKRGYSVKTSFFSPDATVMNVMCRTIDQLQNAIDLIKLSPDSRRIIVSAWNPGTLEDVVLPPCHTFFQFWTCKMAVDQKVQLLKDRGLFDEFYELHQQTFKNRKPVHLYEFLDTFMEDRNLPTRFLKTLLFCRSQDLAVGTPFNIAQYGLLTQMVGKVTNTEPSELIWVGGDCHVYADQVDLAEEQLTRTPLDNKVKVSFKRDVASIDDFTFEDITIEGYDNCHPAIKYPVAV